MKKELEAFMNWFRTQQEYQNASSATLVELWRSSDEYNKFLAGKTDTNHEREEKKKEAMKQMSDSKNKLMDASSNIFKSLKQIVHVHKEEVTEKLLTVIKETIEKVENK